MFNDSFTRAIAFLLICLTGIACRNSVEEEGHAASDLDSAKYFTIGDSDSSGIKVLSITNLWSGKNTIEKYQLVPRDCTGILATDANAIPYPVERVVCMSSSHVAYLSELGKEETIKGISGTRFIYNEEVKRLISEEKIVDVGGESLPNYELIISLRPDLVIAYGIVGGDNTHIEKLRQYGVKVITIGDYLENNALGKMEYLKLFGELTDQRAIADSIYNHKRSLYLETKEKIGRILKEREPVKVIMNAPYKGIWYIPGEKNYTAQLINDAGGVILGLKKGQIESLQLSFEMAYSYALQSDVWLHPNASTRMEELENENKLYRKIPAFISGNVYNNTLRNTPEGGSDFWERGVVEPHIILLDLAKIFYPAEFEEHTLKYYIKLN